MGFLRYLDVIIGYALAMVILSTMIGAAAAGWLAVIGTRSRHMRSGLASLIGTAGELSRKDGWELASGVILDPTVKPRGLLEWFAGKIGGSSLYRFLRKIRGHSAETIQREELALVVLRQAAEGKLSALKTLGVEISDENRKTLSALKTKLAEFQAQSEPSEESEKAGERIREEIASIAPVAKARELAAKVEASILAEEVRDPNLPSQIWRTRALNEHVPALASRLFSQFDNLMDRVEDNVGLSGKLASFVFAAVFLFNYPVDSIAMLNRLSSDEKIRASMVASAENVAQAGSATTAQSGTEGAASKDKAVEEAKRELLAAGLFGDIDSKKLSIDNLPGLFLTWVMVGLGAPFWLSVLDKLLGLRSVMARKATEQRSLRDQDLRPAEQR